MERIKKAVASALAAVALVCLLVAGSFAFSARSVSAAEVSAADAAALQQAIEDASTGDTVQLSANITANITVPEGSEITLDLGGYTLTPASTDTATVTNLGTLNVVNSAATTGSVAGETPFANSGTLRVSGGKYLAPIPDAYLADGYVLSKTAVSSEYWLTNTVPALAQIERGGEVYSFASLPGAISAAQEGETVKLVGNVTLNGQTISKPMTLDLGTYTVTNNSRGPAFVLKASDITITGSEGAALNSSNATFEINGTQDAPLKNIRIENLSIATDGASTCEQSVTIGYADVLFAQTAISAPKVAVLAQDGADLQVEGSSVTSPYIGIWVKGETAQANIGSESVITCNGQGAAYYSVYANDGAEVTISDAELVSDYICLEVNLGSTATVTNTKLEVTYVGGMGVGVGSGTANRVELKDCQIDATKAEGGVGISAYGPESDGETAVEADRSTYNTLSVTGCTINADSFALCGNGARHGTIFTIADSTLTSADAVAIYHPQYGDMTISGQSLVKGQSGIEMRAGNLTIEEDSVSVVATAEQFAENANANGMTLLGTAVGVCQHSTALPIRVVLSGGSYTAEKALYQANLQGNSTDAVKKVELDVSGGNFEGGVESENVTAFVSGGTFSKGIDEALVADDCFMSVNGEEVVVGGSGQVLNKDVYLIGKVAYDTLAEAVAAVPADGTQTTIILTDGDGDKILSGDGVKVAAQQNIIFDFNGNTYNIDGETVGSIGTTTNGFQLLKGATVEMKDGTLTSSKAKILIQKYCDLTLRDMIVDGSRLAGANPNYVVSNNNGTTTFTGSTQVIAGEGDYAFDIYYWPDGGYDTVKVVFDEDFSGSVVGKIQYATDGTNNAQWFEKATLEIQGSGTFDIALDVSVSASSGLDAADAGIAVSGGTFSAALPESYIADTALLYPDANGGYVVGNYDDAVSGGKVAITTGNVGYASLEEALEAGVVAMIERDNVGEGFLSLDEAVAGAAVGETVKLLADNALSGMLTVDKAITLDLNGFDITGGSSNSNFVIKVAAGGAVITNSAASESVIKTGSVEIICVAVASGLDEAVTIENVTLSIDDARTDEGNLAGIQTQSETLVSNVNIAVRGSRSMIMGILAAGADVTVRDSQLAVYRNGTEEESEVHAIHAQNGSNFAVIDSTIETNDAGIVLVGSLSDGNAAAAADPSTFVKLTLEGSTIRADGFAVTGNGATHGTLIDIKRCELVSATTAAIYHPQYGEMTVADSVITGTSGVEVRAGKVTIQSGTLTATAPFSSKPNGDGTTTEGAALVLVQHTTKLPAEVVVTGGTFSGAYAFYQANTEGNSAEAVAKVKANLLGGTYEGAVSGENLTAYITGGKFAQLPAEEAFAEGYEGELYNGYYVVVESGTEDVAGLLTAQLNAQADVRTYAASLGLLWTDLQEIADASEILQQYAMIENAASLSAVAVAKISALDAIDAYMAELNAYRSAAVDAIESAAAAESVVVPTATYAAINGAVSKAEVDAYKTNALAEIAAIVELRTRVEAQTAELENISAAVEELKDAFSGESSEFGALLDDIRAAIDAAKQEIADGTSESLQAMQTALEEKIDEGAAAAKTALEAVQAQLSGYAAEVKDMAAQLSAALGEHESAVQADLDALQASIGGMQTDIDALAEALEAEGGNLADLAEDIAEVKSAVDGMSSTVMSTVTAAQEAIEQKIEGTDNAAAFTAVYVLVSIALVLSAAAVVLLVVVLVRRPKVVTVSENGGHSGSDAE